jgi:hypothetical protein
METSSFSRFVLSLGITAAILPACSAFPTTTVTPRSVPHIARRTASTALLYVVGGGVYIISYPKGQLIGTITNIRDPQGACSDKNGNVFITAYITENVLEYAHGGTTPIAKLEDFGYYPLGCAVDPTTGNLAVANQAGMGGAGGNVAIYTNAKGKPTYYNTYNSAWCAYDQHGDLFVVSTGGSLSEMPAGSKSFIPISLSVSGQGIQWDGQYLALVNPSSKVVYRVAISGSSGTVVATVKFSGLIQSLGYDFLLVGKSIVMPFALKQFYFLKIGVWDYPHGGNVEKTIHPSGGGNYYSLTLSV